MARNSRDDNIRSAVWPVLPCPQALLALDSAFLHYRAVPSLSTTGVSARCPSHYCGMRYKLSHHQRRPNYLQVLKLLLFACHICLLLVAVQLLRACIHTKDSPAGSHSHQTSQTTDPHRDRYQRCREPAARIFTFGTYSSKSTALRVTTVARGSIDAAQCTQRLIFRKM